VQKAVTVIFVLFICVGLSGCLDTGMKLDVTPSAVIHYYNPPGNALTIVDTGAYFDIEYSWKVGEDFVPPQKDLTVFVHFVNSSGNIIIAEDGKTVQDDHEPPVPVTQWKPGQNIVYTRNQVSFPKDIGGRGNEIKMYVGLFDPETYDRAELNSSDETPEKNKAYLVQTILLKDNPYIHPLFDETWHGPEPNKAGVNRWTKKESTVLFNRYPQAEAAELWISGHSPIEDLDPEIESQTLSIYIHEKKPEFLITEKPIKFVRPGAKEADNKLIFAGERLRPTRLPIPQDLYETYSDQPIKFIIEVNQYLTPASPDNREQLGFQFETMVLVPTAKKR
jgi:hypothetical protein